MPDPQNPYTPGSVAFDLWNKAHGVGAQGTPQTAAAPTQQQADPNALTPQQLYYPSTTTARTVAQGPQTTSEVGQTQEATTGATQEATTGATQEQRTGQTTTTRTGTTNVTGSRTEFIDVPTPAEFLDDFHNGFATHITNLHAAGLPLLAANWALEHESLFLARYLGALGNMAAAGQPIFTAVGGGGTESSSEKQTGGVTSRTTGGTTTTAKGEGTTTQKGQATTQQVGATTTQATPKTDVTTGKTTYDFGGPGAEQKGITPPTGGEGGLAGPAAAAEAAGVTVPGGAGGYGQTTAETTTTTPGAQTRETNLTTGRKTDQTTGRTSAQKTTTAEDTSNITKDLTTTNRDISLRPTARDKPAAIHTLSPLGFLGGNAGMSDIQMMYEGLKYSGVRGAAGAAPELKGNI